MKKEISVVFVVLVSSAIVSGCATYGGYQPVVDPYNDPNAYRSQQDAQECQGLAREASSTGMETAKGVAAGGLLGAAAGAAIGAVAGSPGTGAAIGAAAGGIGGGTYTGTDADNQYKRAYINCMRNRGHNVVN
jgi:outer membrane lipoprotein SlyB